MKSVNLCADLQSGVALWQRQDERVPLHVNTENGEYRKVISVPEDESVKFLNHTGFNDLDVQFKQLKWNHTIVGMYVCNQPVISDETEEIEDFPGPLTVQTLWVHNYKKAFYSYYGMSVETFRTRCNDM